MTAKVSFYLIAILALRVNGHSLQERNVMGNVLIVDHHDDVHLPFLPTYLSNNSFAITIFIYTAAFNRNFS